MAESIVQDWLSEYQRVQGQTSALDEFANEHETVPHIAEAIYTIFTERQKPKTLVRDICQQLLTFYRSSDQRLRNFPLQFIPVLIYAYLHSVATGDTKNAHCIETLLICLYNGEVSTDDGGQRVTAFRMPILARASVYHEERNLPMTDLRRWEENFNIDVKWGPHPQIEAISAHNRLKIITSLMFEYNQQVSLTQKTALLHLCRVASQLVNQGFSRAPSYSHRISYSSDPSGTSTPRIGVSPNLLVELVHAIYFAMFNGFGTVAIQALDDIHQRACYEMYTDVILITSAIRNSLNANPSGQPTDGPMGLSVALTPATNTVTTSISKSMITNASFRTKKLPDDIPIQAEGQAGSVTATPQLTSVTEETEAGAAKDQQTSTRNSIIRPSMEGIKAQAHKALIAGFKKSKDKEKDRAESKGGSGSAATAAIPPAVAAAEPPKVAARKYDKHTPRNQPDGRNISMATIGMDNGSETAPNRTSGYGSGSCISQTTSLTSSDLIMKSFDSAIEALPSELTANRTADTAIE